MPEFDRVKDSGDRTKFETGAVRDARAGKGRYDLIPPKAIRRIAKHYENGASKYGDRNWEKGMPQSKFMESAMRHLYNALEGLDDEDHLSAAAWNILAMIEQQERFEEGSLPKNLDDLPRKHPKVQSIPSRFPTPPYGHLGAFPYDCHSISEKILRDLQKTLQKEHLAKIIDSKFIKIPYA